MYRDKSEVPLAAANILQYEQDYFQEFCHCKNAPRTTADFAM